VDSESKGGWFLAPWCVLGAACLALHLLVNNRYGVFSDELYFIVCGDHPALGYVDQPPLVPLLAAASHALFGTALLPLRLIPALAMSATVALTCEVTRLIGGRRFAQWLAGLAALMGGIFLVDGLLFTTDALQPITWLGCSWCLIKLAQTKDERWWLAFGLIAGFSLQDKYLILFYMAGLAPGVLATPLRRSLARPQLYLGAAIALAIAAPSLWWQSQHGWPFIELGRAGQNGKNLVMSPLAFLAQETLFVGPAALPIWLAGLWRYSTKPTWPELRVFPIAFAVMIALFYGLHGKTYYLAPVYPVLLAGGALAIEDWLRWTWARGLALAVVGGVGALLALVALPILPPARYDAFSEALGLSASSAQTESGAQGLLPLHLAGQIGWREMAAKVSAVYNALPPPDKARAVFYGRDYGEAAALDVYGPQFHGPPAIAGHNNYWLWGPGPTDGSVVISLGPTPTQLAANYRSITVAGQIDSPYALPYDAHPTIVVLRGPIRPLAQIWPTLRFYE
jgi:hypothetical protein